MSRYAQRLAPPPSNSRYHRPEDYYYEDVPPPPRGYRGGPVGVNDEDGDDDTAVATDLSGLERQQPRRGVSFGQNEVEEFNGSEAPEAVLPARSRSRMGNHAAPTPPPPMQQDYLAPPGIGRPRSARDGTRRSSAMPPPPQPPRYSSSGRNDYYPSSERERERGSGYGRPVSFARSGAGAGYLDDEPLDPDDDDDAFTAVATGVATDLDMDDGPRRPSPASQGYGYGGADSRDRHGYAAQQNGGGFAAIARPPSRGVQVHRPMPPTSPPQFAGVRPHYPSNSRSASGYEASDFSLDGEGDDGFGGPAGMPPPPLPSSRRASGSASGLAPPTRNVGRAASTGNMRMLLDDDGEGGLSPTYGRNGGGVSRQGTPRQGMARQPTPMQDDEPPAQDSPVEKELIALLKELRFSIALKDFHDTMKIGVQKTLVAEDGMGHAYCKVHCKKLPRHEDIAREAHLRNHWIPLAGSRWEFRTASHRVTVVFKTAALAAYEAQFLTGRG
ncbi:hypothetical protein JCM10213_008075 [Rhodosporidiobolus nylandii]